MTLVKINTIRGRIIFAIIVVTLPLIVMTTVLLSLFTVNSFKNFQKANGLNRANFVTAQTIAAMFFDDKERGSDILANFKNEDDVDAAYIFDKNSELFAKFEKNPELEQITLDDKKPYAKFKNGKLYIATEIIYKESEFLGTLYINMNLDRLKKTMNFFISMMVITIVIMAILAFILADKSQKSISHPILTLAAFAKSISEDSSENKRISLFGNDEIGTLYKRFNDMLDKIEERDSVITSASNLLQDIINSSPAVLIVIGEDERIKLHNNKVLNYISDDFNGDIIGQNIWKIFPVLEEFDTLIKSVISSEKDRELRGISFHLGEIESADITIFHLNETKGGGIVILINDVTEINEKEQQLIQIQKMETVGTLAGGLAHDFNNAMGGIVGSISILENQAAETTNNDYSDIIDILKISAERATSMVTRLLTLSHKSETKFENVDLVESVNSIVKVLNNSIDKSVKISTDYRNEKAAILADANQIEQILLNICVNAAHSMTIMRENSEERGGVLSLVIEHVNLNNGDVKGITAGKYQHLSISDTGVGIPESVQKRMFDPFFTTKDKGKGTGLGLSMVFNLVKRYEGHLVVESETGKGSTFHIYFPQTYEIVEDENFENLSTVDSGKHSGNILLIDDEKVVRFVARRILEECGFTIMEFEKGEEGVAFFNDNHSTIDLVLLDMVMPEMSGEKVFEKIRAIDPECKILLSSGFKEDERVLNLLNKGVDGFIHKPYNFKELSEAVLRLIKKK